MSVEKNSCGVEVLTADLKLFKRFRSVREAAEFLGYTQTGLYSKCDGEKLHHIRGYLGKYIFKIIPKELNTEDAIRRASETEDETRRRLGLNPYGDWRNDEWIFAMVDRVNKEHRNEYSEAYQKYGNNYESIKKNKLEGTYFDTEIDTRNWEL